MQFVPAPLPGVFEIRAQHLPDERGDFLKIFHAELYRAIINLLEAKLHSPVTDRRISVLGLAFKPDTVDTRESAGPRIAEEPCRRGADVIAPYPMVTEGILQRDGFASPPLAPSLAAAMAGAHAAIIATSWPE